MSAFRSPMSGSKRSSSFALGAYGGSRRRSRRGSHYPRYGRRRERRRWPLAVLLLVVVAAAAVAARVITEPTPHLREQRVLPASVTIPGKALAPAWPATGEAAFTVPGSGTMASPRQTPQPIASIAKVMTAYLVLRDHPLAANAGGFTVTVSAADVADLTTRQAQAESTVPVALGEQLDEQQLLEGLLVPSGNNIADLLANYESANIPAFVTQMNAAAKSLGMTATTYTDPSGFADTTVSTARDQTLLAAAVMRQPAFARIVAQKTVNLPVAGVVTNFDTQLGVDGFDGIKTGSDAQAGGCFMFAAVHTVDGRPVPIYGAVLGQDVGQDRTATLVNAASTASSQLVDSVLGALAPQTVLAAGVPVLHVRDAEGHVVTATTTAPLTVLAWPGTSVALSVAARPVGTDVRQGQVLATVTTAGGQGGVTASTSAVTTATMPALTTSWKLRHVL